MAKVGRPRKLESPKQLEEIFEEYKIHTKSNPRIKYHLNQRSGDMVGEPLEVPYTMEGFEIYCWKIKEFSVCNYFDKKDNYEEFYTVCTHIRKEIRDDQIKGGMVGQYNASITQRLNSLKEQIEQTNIEQPLFPDVSTDESNK
jgi:hypothetical protein